PVTFGQFQAFVEADDGIEQAEWWIGLQREHSVEEQLFAFFNHPRDSVSWYQAVAFSRWLNSRYHRLKLFEAIAPLPEEWEIRLPTEWEWQYAATGGNNANLYPWGDWDERRCNTVESRLRRATAVGMYLQGASAYDALDMSG